MNESEVNIGEFLKKNKAIFNYIYDSRGFRIGVVLAKKGDYLSHNLVGWALFQEVDTACWVQAVKIKTLPSYKELTETLERSINNSLGYTEKKDSKALEILENAGLFDIYNAFKILNKTLGDTYIYSEDDEVSIPTTYEVKKDKVVFTKGKSGEVVKIKNVYQCIEEALENYQ